MIEYHDDAIDETNDQANHQSELQIAETVEKKAEVIEKYDSGSDDGSEGAAIPMTRSQGRPELRDIRQTPGSHRNKFEREF